MSTPTHHTLQQRWKALAPREQNLVLAASAIVALALLWWVALAPALKTLRTAPARHAALDAQLQRMQSLQAEALQLQAAPRGTPGDAVGSLRASLTQRLGATAQLSLVGDRATITLKGAQRAGGCGRNATRHPGQCARCGGAALGRQPGAGTARALNGVPLVFRNVSSSLRPRQRIAATAAPRSPWGWAAAGVLVGVLPAVISFAPAQWLARAVDSATGGQVLLAQARGTVWTGSAQLVLTGGGASQDRAALPGRLEWQLRPTLRGLRAQVHAACCMTAPLQARLDARWGGARLALADGQSQLPAGLLTGLGTPWNTLQPQGQLAVQTQGFEAAWAAGRMALTGTVQLDARAMSSRLSTLRPMGSYRLVLQGGDVPTLTLGTLDGHLQLSGSGQWVGQRLRFTGEASATPEREAALANLLNIIGRRNGARSIITVG